MIDEVELAGILTEYMPPDLLYTSRKKTSMLFSFISFSISAISLGAMKIFSQHKI